MSEMVTKPEDALADPLAEVLLAPVVPPELDCVEPLLPPAFPPTTAFTAVIVPETGAVREHDAKFFWAVSTAI